MAENLTSNPYEEARNQRLLENNKRFEELGIQQIAKTLSVLTKPEKKMFSEKSDATLKRGNAQKELRRSKRTHNPNPVYRQDRSNPTINPNPVYGLDIIRTLQEVKNSTAKKQLALKSALKFQSEMKSENPSYVKSISHGSICNYFAIDLPGKFSKKYFLEGRMDLVLEDEDGNQYEVVKSMRGHLGVGWKSFALDHDLDYGDALLFELVEPQKFKIYIFRALDGNVKEESAETKTT